MTPYEFAVLDAIATLTRKKGLCPSMRELAKHLGRTFVRKGYLFQEGARAFRVLRDHAVIRVPGAVRWRDLNWEMA